jgi:hypothetical protein
MDTIERIYRGDTIRVLYARLLLVLQVVLTLVIGWWAVCFEWPMSDFGQGAVITQFSRVMPRDYWAILFAAAAVAGVLGILAPLNRDIRVFSIALLSTGHAVIALMLLAGGLVTPGIVAYSAWGLVGYFLLWTHLKYDFV